VKPSALALICSVGALSAIGDPAMSQRKALAIGNKSYRFGPLHNTVNDATGIAEALRRLGFTVTTGLDLDRIKLESTIDSFIRSIGSEDTVLIYYSGHGMQIEGENYLIPIDFDASDPITAKYETFPVSKLVEGLQRRHARVSIVILDACRNNPFRVSRAVDRGLAPMSSAEGMYIAFATAPGSVADDNKNGSNGLFTKYLLEEMAEPGISIDELFSKVREKVYNESNEHQLPWSSSSLIGTFYFSPQVNTSANSTPPDPRPAARRQAEANDRNAADDPPRLRGMPPLSDNRGGDVFESVVASALKRVPEMAEPLLSPAGTTAEDSLDALRLRGLARLGQRDYAGAVTDLTSAVENNRGDYRAYYYRSLAYTSLREPQRALQDLSRALALAPSFAEARAVRGAVYANECDCGAAFTELRLAGESTLPDVTQMVVSLCGPQQ